MRQLRLFKLLRVLAVKILDLLLSYLNLALEIGIDKFLDGHIFANLFTQLRLSNTCLTESFCKGLVIRKTFFVTLQLFVNIVAAKRNSGFFTFLMQQLKLDHLLDNGFPKRDQLSVTGFTALFLQSAQNPLHLSLHSSCSNGLTIYRGYHFLHLLYRLGPNAGCKDNRDSKDNRNENSFLYFANLHDSSL